MVSPELAAAPNAVRRLLVFIVAILGWLAICRVLAEGSNCICLFDISSVSLTIAAERFSPSASVMSLFDLRPAAQYAWTHWFAISVLHWVVARRYGLQIVSGFLFATTRYFEPFAVMIARLMTLERDNLTKAQTMTVAAIEERLSLEHLNDVVIASEPIFQFETH
jgi:hypothetical protein